MADRLSDHTGHTIRIHDARWAGCSDCSRWIDTRHTVTTLTKTEG